MPSNSSAQTRHDQVDETKICVKIPVMTSADVKEFRLSLGMSQARFGEFVGVPVGTVASWESSKRGPSAPSQALLSIIKERSVQVIEARRELSNAVDSARVYRTG